jgi:hypothetical protein
MEEIINLFLPYIRKLSKTVTPQDRNDLEQEITEKIIRVVYKYDICEIPNFTTFLKMNKLGIVDSVEQQFTLPGTKPIKHEAT